MTKKRLLTVAAAVLLLAGAAVYLLHRQPLVFNGEQLKTDDRYALAFSRMNGTDTHELLLEAGDALSVTYSVTGGRVDIQIGREGESPVYTGNDIDNAAFTVGIPAAGRYRITVTAHNAAGSLTLQAQRQNGAQTK